MELVVSSFHLLPNFYQYYLNITALPGPRLFKEDIEGGRGGWRNSSVVKSSDCSSRGPRFNSQDLHGSSQLSVISVPGGP